MAHHTSDLKGTFLKLLSGKGSENTSTKGSLRSIPALLIVPFASRDCFPQLENLGSLGRMSSKLSHYLFMSTGLCLHDRKLHVRPSEELVGKDMPFTFGRSHSKCSDQQNILGTRILPPISGQSEAPAGPCFVLFSLFRSPIIIGIESREEGASYNSPEFWNVHEECLY